MQVGPSRKEPPVLVSNTVSCEHAEVLVSRRLDGELDPDDALLLDAHLKNCKNCRDHLDSWSGQSEDLSQSLNGLWTVPSDALLKAVQVPKAEKPRQPFWVPLGMMASQFAALIGLALYIMFCATPASAPVRVSDSTPPTKVETKAQPETPAPAPVQIEAAKIAPQVSEAPAAPPAPVVETPAPVVTEKPAQITVPVAISVSHVESTVVAPVVKEQSLGSINIPHLPTLIPNVAMDFEIAIPGKIEKDSGRVAILGDIYSGKAVIRLTESSGAVSEIAQPDLDTILSAPRRTLVKRFIAECKRPEVRSRFEEILRRQNLDASK